MEWADPVGSECTSSSGWEIPCIAGWVFIVYIYIFLLLLLLCSVIV